MKVSVIGSSSEGNCYLFRAKRETLIVECGLPIRDIKRALDFNLTGVVGCVVTHRHKDHSRSVADMCGLGIRTYALADVFDATSLASPFASRVTAFDRFKVGGFDVMAAPARHDVPCLSYFIWHEEMGWTVFVTDSVGVTVKPKRIHHIMIECNYSDEILEENIERGILHRSQRDRLMVSHCSLDTCKGILKKMNLDECREITLLHLSHSNADPERFKAEIEKATGKPTYIATPGLEVDFTI